MTKEIINQEELDTYFQRYIDKVGGHTDLRAGMLESKKTVSEFFENIPADKHAYAYAEEKWTIMEVLQHVIDTERVFSYRLFRIGRGDKAPLMGFDQDIYIAPSRANQKGMASLIAEFKIARDHTLSLLGSLTDEDLENIGTSSEHALSARAAAFIILGHEIWHMDIVRDRYLQ